MNTSPLRRDLEFPEDQDPVPELLAAVDKDIERSKERDRGAGVSASSYFTDLAGDQWRTVLHPRGFRQPGWISAFLECGNARGHPDGWKRYMKIDFYILDPHAHDAHGNPLDGARDNMLPELHHGPAHHEYWPGGGNN